MVFPSFREKEAREILEAIFLKNIRRTIGRKRKSSLAVSIKLWIYLNSKLSGDGRIRDFDSFAGRVALILKMIASFRGATQPPLRFAKGKSFLMDSSILDLVFYFFRGNFV